MASEWHGRCIPTNGESQNDRRADPAVPTRYRHVAGARRSSAPDRAVAPNSCRRTRAPQQRDENAERRQISGGVVADVAGCTWSSSVTMQIDTVLVRHAGDCLRELPWRYASARGRNS